MTEARECVEIVNNRGLHARASAKFVNAVAKLGDSVAVTVWKDGAEAAGGSILGLMMLGAAKGDSVDIVVTDYGVAVNPRRPDLLEALKAADCVPLKTIEELRDIAYSIVGEPEKVQFGDRIVGIIEARDGTVMDVVREVKPFSFRED